MNNSLQLSRPGRSPIKIIRMTGPGYSLTGIAHAGAAMAALLSGAWILLTRKGTTTHHRMGWVYVACMVWVNVSALEIRHLTGRFNFFHALAAISLVMVTAGAAQAVYRTRFRRWLWRHYQYMCWSYAGLAAGAVNEACVRVPGLREFSASTGNGLAVLGSAVVIGTAAALIFGNQRRMLGGFGA
jgi:uncharacterized membrane protein